MLKRDNNRKTMLKMLSILLFGIVLVGCELPKHTQETQKTKSSAPLIVEQKISTGQCFMIWAAIVFIIVVTVELLYHKVYATSFEAHHKLFSSLPWVYVELYRILGAFSLGCLFTYTTTELAKFQVGRHFWILLIL